jgi:hypothetical protein
MTATIEERVALLEEKMAALTDEKALGRPGVTGRTNPQALEELFGVFSKSPQAQEVLDSIEAERERERREAREKAA